MKEEVTVTNEKQVVMVTTSKGDVVELTRGIIATALTQLTGKASLFGLYPNRNKPLTDYLIPGVDMMDAKGVRRAFKDHEFICDHITEFMKPASIEKWAGLWLDFLRLLIENKEWLQERGAWTPKRKEIPLGVI